MNSKINTYFIICLIFFSLIPVQAVAPIKYYEIDSDIELRGAIFVNVDPIGFYASLNDGVIQIDSDNHFDNVLVRFKGIALGSRLKKYNGFNVGYTHISEDGTIINELKSLEIDYQGFAYLTTDFSTVIINGMTGITTTTLTGLSGNQSISVPDGSSYDLNITNNQPSVWTINGTDYSKRILWTLNTTAENLTNFQVERVTPYDSDMQVDMDDRQLTYYENDTLISSWDENVVNSTNTTSYVKVPKTSTTGQQQYWHYYGNSSASSASSGYDVFPILFDDAEHGDFTDMWTVVSGSAEYSSTRAFSGTNSIRSPSNSIIKTTDTWGDDTGIIQAMFYDEDLVASNSYLNILSDSNQDWALIGLTNSDVNNYRFYHDGTWYDTGIARSAGWHKLEIVHSGSFIKFYLDDVYLGEDANPAYSTFDQLQIQCGHSGGTEILYYDDIFKRQYTTIEPTWLPDGVEQTATGTININVSIVGDSNEQLYNTSQSREFTLTPTGTINNINVNTACTAYDITIITYWTDDTTQYSQTLELGYVKSYINYTSIFPISIAIFNDTINLGVHNFSNDDYIGAINATINDSYISAIRDGQNINTTTYNLINDTEYLINFTIPYNNIQTVGNVPDIEAFLCIPYSLTAPSFNDPENLGIDNETWHFGDGDVSSSSNPTHTYLTLGDLVGNYSVTEIATISPQTVTKEFNVSVLVQPVQNLTSQVEQTCINFNWSDYECADYWNVSELEESAPYFNTTIILDGNKDAIYDTNAHAFTMHSPNPTTNLDYELVYWFRNSTHLIGWATGYDDDNLNNDDYFLIGIDGENDNLTANDRKFILSESGTVTAKRWGGSSWLPTSTNAEGAVVGGGVAGVITYEMIIPISEMAGFVDDATIKFFMERECSSLTPTVETFYPLNLINSTDATIWATAVLTDGEVYNYIGNTSASEFNSTGLDLYSWYKHCVVAINGTTESAPVYSYDITAGAQHYSVSGYTKDSLGNIVAGVTVWAQNGHVIEATQSDINGFWKGVQFHYGNYTVYGNKSGYAESYIDIIVTGNLTNQNVTLTAFEMTDWMLWEKLLEIEAQNEALEDDISTLNSIIWVATLLAAVVVISVIRKKIEEHE